MFLQKVPKKVAITKKKKYSLFCFKKLDSSSSSGGNSRPNLLIGGFPTSGNGKDDFVVIYGNFVVNNPSEALFQGNFKKKNCFRSSLGSHFYFLGTGNIDFHHVLNTSFLQI